MTRLACIRLALPTLLASICAASLAHAAGPKSAEQLLPASTVAYMEVTRPKELLGTVLDHPLRKQLEQLQEYQAAFASEDYRRFRLGRAYVETVLETDWRSALETLTAGGIYLAYDPASEGAVVLVHSADEQFLTKAKNTALMLARNEAHKNGDDDPINEDKYRGIDIYTAKEGGGFATLGEWLVLTNKADLGKQVIDAYLDGNAASLASNGKFQAARKSIEGQPAAWAYVDLDTVRANAEGDAAKVFNGKADDPGAELLVGGILANLKEAPYATAAFYLTQQQARLQIAMPHDFDWVSEAREFYFGPQGQGHAPPLLKVGETIAAVSVYRDFSGMWLRAGELFDEQTLDQLAQADSTLSTLFSGRDFGEDILGAIGPEVQFVVTRQTFDAQQITPTLKLPAFAGVARLREPESMQRELKRIFQSLIGFYNVVGAMNNQPPLDLGMESKNQASLVTGTFAPEADEKQSKAAPIHFNFSPTLAFSGDRMILASTTELARQIIDAPDPAVPDAARPTTNTQVALYAGSIAKALVDNREHLIAHNMLEQGHDREQAEQEISVLMTLIGLLENALMKLETTADTLSFEAEVNLK